MRNRPFYMLVAIVSSIIALLIFWIYLAAVGGNLPENTVGGLCTIFFLIVAVIAYELLTKPGLYSRRRKEEERVAEKEEQGKEGVSP